MRQCTKPEFTFTLPFDTALLANCLVTFRQYGEVLVEAGKDRCELEGNIITVRLDPEDTLLFCPKEAGEVQLQVLTTKGEPFTSDPYTFDVEECFSRKVLK